jgi:hypothetical protein
MTAAETDDRARVVVDYVPTDRQAVAHTTYADELLYGGAAGGGKSRFARAEALAFALEVPGSATLILRKSFPDLNRPGAMIPKWREETPNALGRYNITEARWTARNGSTVDFGYLSSDGDVGNYQGAEFQLIIIDEATQQTEYRIRYLMSRLRASGPVRDRLEELGYRPRLILTANPGGVGHAFIKGRYIDPMPPEQTWRPHPSADEPKPGTRVFVPARVSDNPHIDTDYVDRLDNLDTDTRRALKDGDWDVYAGQRFRDFRRDVHVIDPEDLPLSLGGITRAVGVDYGLDAPFAAVWGARLADGLIVVYRELYQPGLTPEEQAILIRDSEAPGERTTGRPVPVALDPSTWARNPHVKSARGPGATVVDNHDDGPPPGSIADAYRQVLGREVIKARNDRLAGVALVASKLRVRADGLPRLLIYSTCRHTIRTLPALPRDPKRPEDVDTKAEDHLYDALRYLIVELETADDQDTTSPPEPLAGSRTSPGDPAPTTTTGHLGAF